VVLLGRFMGVIPAATAWSTYDTTTPATAPIGAGAGVRVAVVARSPREGQVTAGAPIWNVGSDVAVSYVDAPGNAATVCAGALRLPLTLSH
jgi:hypothetical protein